VPEIKQRDPEAFSDEEVEAALRVIFDERAYAGPKEAKTISWMVARATDSKGVTFPREIISYGNIARDKQKQRYHGLTSSWTPDREEPPRGVHTRGFSRQ
jgi:hypothetical protein